MKTVRSAMLFALAIVATLMLTGKSKACAGLGLAYSAYTAPVVLTQPVVVAPVVQPVVASVVTPAVVSQAVVAPVVVPVVTPVFAFNTFHGYNQNVIVQREVIVRDRGFRGPPVRREVAGNGGANVQRGLVNLNVGGGGGGNVQRGLLNLKLGR